MGIPWHSWGFPWIPNSPSSLSNPCRCRGSRGASGAHGVSGARPNGSPAHTAPLSPMSCPPRPSSPESDIPQPHHPWGTTASHRPPRGPCAPLTWGAAGSSKVGAQPAEEEEEEDRRKEGAGHRHGGASCGARANSLCTQPTAQGCRLPHPRRFLPHSTARCHGAHTTGCSMGHSKRDCGSLHRGPAAHPTGARHPSRPASRLTPLGPTATPWFIPPCSHSSPRHATALTAPPQGCSPGAGPVWDLRPMAPPWASWAGSLGTGQNWESLGQSQGAATGRWSHRGSWGQLGAVMGGGRGGQWWGKKWGAGMGTVMGVRSGGWWPWGHWGRCRGQQWVVGCGAVLG